MGISSLVGAGIGFITGGQQVQLYYKAAIGFSYRLNHMKFEQGGLANGGAVQGTRITCL